MRAMKIIGHPVLILTVFLLILISGKAFGGPYIIYILMGLARLNDYAIIGFLGLTSLVISHNIGNYNNHLWIKPSLTLFGIFLLVLSLYIFFENDSMQYNENTFEQTVPIISFMVFGLCSVCGVIVQGLRLREISK